MNDETQLDKMAERLLEVYPFDEIPYELCEMKPELLRKFAREALDGASRAAERSEMVGGIEVEQLGPMLAVVKWGKLTGDHVVEERRGKTLVQMELLFIPPNQHMRLAALKEASR